MHNQAARKSSQSTHDYQITTTRLVSVKQKAGVTGAVSATSRSRATTRHIQTLNYLTIFIYILLSVCCFNNVNSHESNYYYYYNSEGDAIQVKNSESNESKESIQSLLPKDFFSVFSSEIPILNSVENQSLNDDASIKTYSENSADSFSRQHYNHHTQNQPMPNQIPIVKFFPAVLNFGEQFIGMPKVQTVRILNIGPDQLRLDSISGSTVNFYCSFFQQKIIEAGANTSFDVYFLAREIGHTDSSLFINTNKGIIKYTVNGMGVRNPYRLKPILNARIPLNSSFSSQIVLHNPHNVSLQVMEIYTSDDDLHVEISGHLTDPKRFQSTASQKIKTNAIKNGEQNLSSTNDNSKSNINLWHLKPFETRQIAFVHYMGRQANNHTAFICIHLKIQPNNEKIDSEHNQTLSMYFVLPFELEVTKQPGLFSPITQIDFGDVSAELLTPTSRSDSTSSSEIYFNENSATSPVYYEKNGYINAQLNRFKSIDLYLTSSAITPLKIMDIFSVRHNPSLNISYRDNIVLPPDPNQLTKIAKITFDPFKSKKSSQNYGKILVKTNNTNISFQISFNADLHKGSIEFDQNKFNYFVIDNEPDSQSELVNSISFINRYTFNIAVHSINLNEYAQKYFEVYEFNEPVVLKADSNNKNRNSSSSSNINSNDQKTQLFKLKFNRDKYLIDMKNHSQNNLSNIFSDKHHYSLGLCLIETNFSQIQIPINIYDGKLLTKIFTGKYEILNEFNLGSLNIGSKKELIIQIDNYNSIDISLNSLEIKNLADKKINNKFYNSLDLKFLYYEEIDNMEIEKSGLRIYLNNTYLNNDIRNNLKVPAHHRMVVLLIISSSISDLEFKKKFISSDLFKYKLGISTKYEVKEFILEFRFVNGLIELVSSLNKPMETLNISTFPTHISKQPIYLKSTFSKNLDITSIEFLNYGNSFSFKWVPLVNETTNSRRLGLVQSQNTTLIGNIYFDSYNLCEPNCYVGFHRPDRLLYSSSDKGEFIYDLWMRSLTLKPFKLFRNDQTQLDAFDIDLKLIKLFNKRWSDFNRGKTLFSSTIRFQMQLEPADSILQFSFPIKFEFKRSQLMQKNSVVEFSLSQVHTTVQFHNLTVQNPSGSAVFIQIMFINSYPQKENLINLIQNDENFFPAENKQLFKRLFLKTTSVNKQEEAFSLHMPITFDQQKLIQSIEEDYSVIPNRNSFLFLVPPNESRTIQIKFKPNRLGRFEEMLILRNNLTVLDAFILRGEAGTAQLNINNMAPMRSSLFFDGLTTDVLTEPSATSDLSNLVIEMSANDFANCDARVTEPTDTELNDDASSFRAMPSRGYKTSYRSKEGILLRTFLQLRNLGNTDLNVFSVLFDGEPCYSRGIELTDCLPFSIAPNSTYWLEVRYRPDFTMYLIRKSLTVTTNIGDLEYLIEIKIAPHMLAVCHDSLPRPAFEEYLYYVGTFLVILFVFIMFLTSMLESRSLVKYQYKMHRISFYSPTQQQHQDKRNYSSDQNFSSNATNQAPVISSNNNSNNNKQQQRNKSSSSSTETLLGSHKNSLSPPSSPRSNTKSSLADQTLHHRNLTKSLSSSRTENSNGTCSSPTSKKITNPSISKKLKEKDLDSDASGTSTTVKLSVQIPSVNVSTNSSNCLTSSGCASSPSTPPILPSSASTKPLLAKQISSPMVPTSSQGISQVSGLADSSDTSKNLQPIGKSVSFLKNNGNVPQQHQSKANTKLKPHQSYAAVTEAQNGKQNHATQNDLLAVQRCNYLNQQKSQKATKNNENLNKAAVQLQKPQVDLNLENNSSDKLSKTINKFNSSTNKNGNTAAAVVANKMPSRYVNQTNLGNKNLQKTDLDYLNSQFQQLQQQNQQQLKEIKDTVGLGLVGNLSKSSSTSSANSLTHLSPTTAQRKSQYDLLNILYNTNNLEQERPGEFSRSMSILSKRSSSSFSGLLTPGDSISRSTSPTEMNANENILNIPFGYYSHEQQTELLNKSLLLNQLNLLSSCDTSNLKTTYRSGHSNAEQVADDQINDKVNDNFDDVLEHYTIISDNGSFYNEERINSRNSPLSLSSTSASDLWILPTKNASNPTDQLDSLANTCNFDDDYDCIVQETEEFKKNFYNFPSNSTKSEKTLKSSIKRPLNSTSPAENSKESHSSPKCSKKATSLKATVSAPFSNSPSYFDFNKSYTGKNSVAQSKSIPFTNSNKYLGPIQRPNQTPSISQNQTSSNNINNNITNNLFLTLPPVATTSFASKPNDISSTSVTTALDQLFLQLSGEEMLSLLASTVNLPKMNNEDESYFNFVKLNSNNKKPSASSNSSHFDDFSLFGVENSLDKEKNISDSGKVLLPEHPEIATSVESPYWPLIGSLKSNVSSESSAQPWNSVLLNDFNEPASLSSSSSGNHIRKLWSNPSTKEEEIKAAKEDKATKKEAKKK